MGSDKRTEIEKLKAEILRKEGELELEKLDAEIVKAKYEAAKQEDKKKQRELHLVKHRIGNANRLRRMKEQGIPRHKANKPISTTRDRNQSACLSRRTNRSKRRTAEMQKRWKQKWAT